jgi:hypothetical protein
MGGCWLSQMESARSFLRRSVVVQLLEAWQMSTLFAHNQIWLFFSLLKAPAENLVYLEGTLRSRAFSSAKGVARLRKVERLSWWAFQFFSLFSVYVSLTIGFKKLE